MCLNDVGEFGDVQQHAFAVTRSPQKAGEPAGDGTALVPNYALPEFIPSAQANPLFRPQPAIWQDELGPRLRLETRIGEWLGSNDNGDFSVGALLPFWIGSQNSLLFVDARGTSSFSGGPAGSIQAVSDVSLRIRKGETLLDTASTLNAMHCDLLVVRGMGAPD